LNNNQTNSQYNLKYPTKTHILFNNQQIADFMDNIPLTRIGQILFTVPFFVFGLFHLMGADAMAGMVPIPGGVIWIYLVGIALILAGISIVIRKKTRLACLLLALMLLIFVLSIHLPGVLAGGDGVQASLGNLLKDIGLMGGALVIANQFGND